MIRATQAARDVIAERLRQIEVEKFTPEHDDRLVDGELAAAAAVYAEYAQRDSRHSMARAYRGRGISPACWPFTDGTYKPVDRRHDLVMAGALIIAEIERLDRAAAPAGESA